MATGPTTSTTLANVIATVLSRARDYIEKPTVMTDKNVVQKVMIEDGDGLTYNWPKFGQKFSMQDLNEGVPINNAQTLVPSSQQFTTSEIGCMVLLTDKAVRVTKERMWARAGRFCGNAAKRRKETDMLGLFSGLSRDLGAGAGNAFTPGPISAAVKRLRAASESGQTEPAEGEIFSILHPFHMHDILTSSATLGSNINSTSGYFPIPGWTEDLLRDMEFTKLYNSAILSAPLISVDALDDAISATFNNMAFIHVGTSHALKSEKDRDITLRADILVMTTEYGVGELEDQFGFKYTADAAAPTG